MIRDTLSIGPARDTNPGYEGVRDRAGEKWGGAPSRVKVTGA